jgi:hypothetical protein
LQHGALEAVGAVFGWNDLAGTVLADRGWAFGDRPMGLLDHFRLPDVFAQRLRKPTPYAAPFVIEIDNAPGWYAGASWRDDEFGKIAVLRYDNRTDPSLERDNEYGWLTKFWNLSYQTDFGPLTLLSQAMAGSTEIAANPARPSTTDFQAAYVLLGWETGDWTFAGRIDVFATQQHKLSLSPKLSEHGVAETLAANWYARSWLRLSAEALVIESTRFQYTFAGLPPSATETQLQLAARFFF